MLFNLFISPFFKSKKEKNELWISLPESKTSQSESLPNMSLFLQTHYTLSLPSPRYPSRFSNRNPNSNPYNFSPLIPTTPPKSQFQFPNNRSPASTVSASRRDFSETPQLKLPLALVHVTVSAVLFLCCGIRACSASSPPLTTTVVQQEQTIQGFHHFFII